MSNSPLQDPGMRALIEAYLGPQAATATAQFPHPLLGLPIGDHPPATVLAAMQQQLAMLAVRAPGGGQSMEATNLRLVIQETAARLMSGAAPATSFQSSSSSPPPPRIVPAAARPAPAPATSPPPRVPSAAVPPNVDPGLLADAEMLLAKFGGVDPQVLGILNQKAAARGLPPSAVPAVLNALLRGEMPERPQPQPASLQAPASAPVRRSAPAPDREPENEEDPAVVFLRRAIITAAVVFVVVLGALAVTLFAVSGKPGQADVADTDSDPASPTTPVKTGANPALTAKPPAPDSPSTAPSESTTASPPIVAQPATSVEIQDGTTADPAAVLRQARKCVDLARTAPAEGAAKLARTVRILGEAWVRFDAGQKTASTEAVVDAMFAVRRDDAAAQVAINAVAALAAPLTQSERSITRMGSAQVHPAAWATGMMLRLSRERDLAGPILATVDVFLAASLGRERPAVSGTGAFPAGLVAGLRAMPLRIVDRRPENDQQVMALGKLGRSDPVDTAKAFDLWEQAVRSAMNAGSTGSEADRKAAELVVLDGLERVMRDAQEPDEDRAAMEAIGVLVARLKWREQEVTRRRLLSWFDDPTISSADLQTVTAAIVTKSAAENVDLSMVLSHGAAGDQRATLKDAYARSWGLAQSITNAGVSDQWLKVAREALSNLDVRNPELLEEMRSATILAKLNEVAWRRARGDITAGADILTVTIPSLIPANTAGGIVTGPNSVLLTLILPRAVGTTTDGDWAIRFTMERALPARLERIKEIETYLDRLGAVDADILAELALTSAASPELRAAAQRATGALAGQATMVNAMLRILPRSLRNTSVTSTIERATGRSLPGWQNQRWPLEARRALVERLLELVAADPSAKPMDKLAAVLADALCGSVGISIPSGGITDEDGARLARDAAGEMMRKLRQECERHIPNRAAPLSIERIERAHAGRLALARGVVQQFAADELASTELLAFIVTAERPSVAPVAATILANLNQARRDATSVLEQIKHTEAAMLRLWILRAGEGAQ